MRLFIAFIGLFAFQSSVSFAQIVLRDTVTSNALRRSSLSLVTLIANPERYHGYSVEVSGYLHLKFEDAALYLTKADGDYLNGRNAVWVVFADSIRQYREAGRADVDTVSSLQYFDGRYVVLRGTFNKNHYGHMGSFAGALEDIDSISEQRQWYDGRDALWEDKVDGKGLRPIPRDRPTQ